MYKQCLILLVLLALGGVSSWDARLNGKWGSPYYGYEHARLNFVYCGVMEPAFNNPLTFIVNLPITTLDMIGSFIVDTALLPIDIVIDDTDVHVERLCTFRWE